jgi:hypothetical protein
MAAGLAAGAATSLCAAPVAANNGNTIDGRRCPRSGELAQISPLRNAIPAAERFAHLSPARAVIRALQRGPDSGYAAPAARACGAAVVGLSVFVKVHAQGQRCSACDLRAFVVHYRSGAYRVWEAY